MNEWVDGWIKEGMNEQTNITNEWMKSHEWNGWHEWNESKCFQMKWKWNEHEMKMNKCMHAWMDGWMEEGMKEKRNEGRKEGRKE